MSRYDWEGGSLKIPTKEMPALKKRLREGWNAVLMSRFDLSVKLFEHLESEAKGQRNFDYQAAVRRWQERAKPDEDSAYDVLCVLFPYDTKTGVPARKPVRPKKKDLSLANSKTLKFHGNTFTCWEATLVLQDESRTLHWQVPDNNHATERAWAHPMGRVLADALRRITWTRGSGGTFVGNDEYNRDNQSEGGGGNYVTRRFGPLGQSEVLRRLR